MRKKAGSTPTLVAESSNSGSRDPVQGRSKGYRTIIFFRLGTASEARAFFVYGFAKSHRANIDEAERQQFKDAAKHVLALTDRQIAELLRKGDFVEVKTNAQEVSE